MRNPLSYTLGESPYLIIELLSLLTLIGVYYALNSKKFIRNLKMHWPLWQKWQAVIFLLAITLLSVELLNRALAHQPRINDEFSYIYGAETFLLGRLANEPHPFASQFDSIHNLTYPMTVSKYPPMQSAFLALGKLLGGTWSFGIALSSAFAVVAVFCLLAELFSLPWALLGTVIFLTRFILLTYWGVELWGGTVAAGAGSLVYFATIRWYRTRSPGTLVYFFVGLMILAHSRPFQGLVASLPAVVLITFNLVKSISARGVRSPDFTSFIVCLTGAITILASLAYYNISTTGNPWQLAYQLHEQLYNHAPLFLWQQEPAYRALLHDVFEKMWGPNGHEASLVKTFRSDLMGWVYYKINGIWTFYLGTGLSILFVAGLLTARVFWQRLFISALLLTLASEFLVWPTLPHYVAPSAGLVVAMLVAGASAIWNFRPKNSPRIGRLTSAVALGGCTAAVAALCLLYSIRINLPSPLAAESNWLIYRGTPEIYAAKRQAIITQLRRLPGKHLILVDTTSAPRRVAHDAWINNPPDIDQAKLLFAHATPMPNNQDFLNYFSDRKLWLVKFTDNGEPIIESENNIARQLR